MNRTKLYDWIQSRRHITPGPPLTAREVCLCADLFMPLFLGFATFSDVQTTLATYSQDDRRAILGVCVEAVQCRESGDVIDLETVVETIQLALTDSDLKSEAIATYADRVAV